MNEELNNLSMQVDAAERLVAWLDHEAKFEWSASKCSPTYQAILTQKKEYSERIRLNKKRIWEYLSTAKYEKILQEIKEERHEAGNAGY